MKNAKLIEVNDRLNTEESLEKDAKEDAIDLLVSKPETDGFLAVFMFKEIPHHDDPNHEQLLNSFYRKE